MEDALDLVSLGSVASEDTTVQDEDDIDLDVLEDRMGRPLLLRHPVIYGLPSLVPVDEGFMETLSSECDWRMYGRFMTAITRLKNGSVTWQEAAAKIEEALCPDPALLEHFKNSCPILFGQGSDLYYYTAPGTPLAMRADYNHLLLIVDEQAVRGAHYSNECIICMRPFAEKLRTLACAHSFCKHCFSDYLHQRGTVFIEGMANVPCPTCRQISAFTEVAISPMEKGFNALLLRDQAASLRYRCPFEDCPLTFLLADLQAHVDACGHRKYMCDKGCHGVLSRSALHGDFHDCLKFCQTEAIAYKKTAQDLEARLKVAEAALAVMQTNPKRRRQH